MSTRTRVAAFVAVTAVTVGGATAYALHERDEVVDRQQRAPTVAETAVGTLGDGPRIVFRHTGLDRRYGQVALVPLADPGGRRAFTDVLCDRVAAWSGGASCLVNTRGVVSRFEALELGPDWEVQRTHPLPGLPSRTRVSPDGALVATTAFVAGHSYMTLGFSTETVVRELGGGQDWGNLEEFTLVLDGREVRPSDRNVWGVTFADDRRFYATVGSGGRTWLVEGDLDQRTLTSVAAGAECPSLSPDGSRVAFKVDTDPGDETVWGLAVLDLGSGERRELADGPRGVDDQVAWLDDDTLLYGMPRKDEPGITDVWSVAVDGDGPPRVLVEEAWSPTVVR